MTVKYDNIAALEPQAIATISRIVLITTGGLAIRMMVANGINGATE
jgi:hypothetical protein